MYGGFSPHDKVCEAMLPSTLRQLTSLASMLLMSLSGQAVTYYVSPTGNDANAGTSQAAPWRTITRVNQVMYGLAPGDQVLFQRGGSFVGQLTIGSSGVAGNNIVYGAYGTGTAPVIQGSNTVTGWTLHSGNIWKAPVTGSVKYVYCNGALQTLARYPNTGFLRNDVGGSNWLQDAQLTQPNGYWTGGNLVVRSSNWSYDVLPITNYTTGQLSFSSMVYNLTNFEWGYFLNNKLSELDMAGEWFQDPGSGQLYLWAPGGVNPSTLSVQVNNGIEWGVWIYPNRHHVTFTGLTFKHQRSAAFKHETANDITIQACTFQDLNQAFYSFGSNNQYVNNLIERTYATAAMIVDQNSTFADNTLNDIAVIPGMGESTWGYMGLRISGAGNKVQRNRLHNIGYIGIAVEQDCLVERNYIDAACYILNDGSGIGWDNADGAIARENIVVNTVGNLESSAPDDPSTYYYQANGFYYGNLKVQNTVLQNNTFAHCSGNGILVDHTMLSSGNQITGNTCFDNHYQITFSDWSNYSGTGAVSPYSMPTYPNETITGNILYSMNKDQLCMRQMQVWTPGGCDFGTFTNNRYFNAWDESSIMQDYTMAGGTYKYYSVARWQNDKVEDAGSTAHPLKLNAYVVTGELSTNLVQNGTFDVNANGWGGYPTNATAVRDLTYLDNGALRCNLPNNSLAPYFTVRNPNTFSITSGQWYRMKFSIQGDIFGEVMAGVKGVSQISGPLTIHERRIPCSPVRREVELVFQAGITDNAYVQFVNQHTDPRYWVDNIQVHRVSVQPVDPTLDHIILYNDQQAAQTMSLPAGNWCDVDGVVVTGSIVLQPFRSRVLYRTTAIVVPPPPPPSYTVGSRMYLGGALNWGSNLMRDNLRIFNLLPNAEPYTGLGLPVANTGATMGSGLIAQTGSTAIVDWILVELRNNDATYTVAERRAALVRANGDVINPDGSAFVTFTTNPVGKRLAFRHRNHLAVMSGQNITSNGQVMDFTTPGFAAFGTNPMQTDGIRMGLWPGDVNTNGVVRYTGSANDRDPVLTAIGGVVPTATVTGYRREDVNLDGWTIYTGSGNDRDFILTTIGGTMPTNTRSSTVP